MNLDFPGYGLGIPRLRAAEMDEEIPNGKTAAMERREKTLL